MGCLCSKNSPEPEKAKENESEKEHSKSSVQLVAPALAGRDDFIVQTKASRRSAHASVAKDGHVMSRDKEDSKTRIVERPKKSNHHRWSSAGVSGSQAETSFLSSLPNSAQGEHTLAGWPQWLASVAGEAIQGWFPRRADSFESLDKIGQGTYSSVYKARDLETGKIVALKKVKFANMDADSVRFMAREIVILRRLDHPNVVKLEGLVTSRVSCSLYLVLEYMEHDLAGLAARPGIKFTEPQIKCYVQQLLRGLEHCHNRGVLHRDIKGSNLLINKSGVLKIGDFGLANFFGSDQKQPLTSRVVTLWYRAPELLLGSTQYGAAVDLWSVGCILAELFSGKPILPGRTEVEQMHKIFKLCGSPSGNYWQRTRLPHATSFKPQHGYKRCLLETFRSFPCSALALVDKLLTFDPDNRGSAISALKSEFFRAEPLPCDPSSLPTYPPSKEFDAKRRGEEAPRRRAEAARGRGPESVRRGSRDLKEVPSPEFKDQDDRTTFRGRANPKTFGHIYNIPRGASKSEFLMEEAPRGALRNGFSHSTSLVNPSAAGVSSNKTAAKSREPQAVGDLPSSSIEKDDHMPEKDFEMGYTSKKSRIHYSGPLVPPGGNIEDMLKEHERLMQEAFRKPRPVKSGANESFSIRI